MYENWKILKSEADEKADEYASVANWCNKSGKYMITEDGEYYKVTHLPKPPSPSNEELKQFRADAYATEVDGITAHIQRLRDTIPMTEEVEAKIIELIAERNIKVTEIKERYPYIKE